MSFKERGSIKSFSEVRILSLWNVDDVVPCPTYLLHVMVQEDEKRSNNESLQREVLRFLEISILADHIGPVYRSSSLYFVACVLMSSMDALQRAAENFRERESLIFA